MNCKLKHFKYTTLLAVFFSISSVLPSQGMERENEMDNINKKNENIIIEMQTDDSEINDLNDNLITPRSVTFMDRMSVVPSALTGCGAVVSILAQSIKTYCRYHNTTVPLIVEPILLVGEVLWLSSAVSGVWYNWKKH